MIRKLNLKTKTFLRKKKFPLIPQTVGRGKDASLNTFANKNVNIYSNLDNFLSTSPIFWATARKKNSKRSFSFCLGQLKSTIPIHNQKRGKRLFSFITILFFIFASFSLKIYLFKTSHFQPMFSCFFPYFPSSVRYYFHSQSLSSQNSPFLT